MVEPDFEWTETVPKTSWPLRFYFNGPFDGCGVGHQAKDDDDVNGSACRKRENATKSERESMLNGFDFIVEKYQNPINLLLEA